MHVNENHWVTAFSKNLSTVSIYDSHRAKIYPVSFLEDIATILQTRKDKVTIVCENVDQQADVNQCGVYAVAFATALCLGLDPCDLKFENPCKLRAHLVSMLEGQYVSLFPSKPVKKIKKPFKTFDFNVYCHCRLPWNIDSNIDMIECSNCKEWYHTKVCETNLHKEAFCLDEEWLCSVCLSS